MTPKSNLLIAILTFIGCFVLLALRPVPATAVQNIKSITGKVVKVSEDGNPGEVMIQLNNDDRTYYINRGNQNGLNLQILQNNLLGRQATLSFEKYWNPQDFTITAMPVARLTVAGQTYLQEPTAKFVGY